MGPGSNANRNRKYCSYCKLQNHRQEEWKQRIRKKPCCDAQGRAYWPKVYLRDESNDPKSEQKAKLVFP
jgi:hypothetical protein